MLAPTQFPNLAALATEGSPDELIGESLHCVRQMLGMRVAFVSEFRAQRRVFRYVDCVADFSPISVGGSDPVEDSYCQRVVDGRLPELIHDARLLAEARTLAATMALPVGAHLSVPIYFSDGRVYGTFCCFSTQPDNSLNDRDLATMRLFARMMGWLLEKRNGEEQVQERIKGSLEAVLQERRYVIHYQPVYQLAGLEIVGYEALARFTDQPVRGPDQWLNDAGRVEMREELELALMRSALEALPRLPRLLFLALNASPQVLHHKSLPQLLKQHPLGRLMLELTEHEAVADYNALMAVLQPLRAQGLSLAVDDAGAGYASLSHILKLKPGLIKLDRSLIQQIDYDEGKQALAASMVRFAARIGSRVLAEGVETESQLRMLQSLGVSWGQGYLLGRPAPLPF